MNKLLLKLEGLTVVITCIYFYAHHDYSWLTFFLLLLVPDLSMLGYLFGKNAGAIAYNIFHTYLWPMAFILISLAVGIEALLMYGFIWGAHIGMDRMLGYGLKYPTDFKDTHLQRV
ncbi:DUF4260 domain-containing protein [Ammoniphilus sp. CFH 90114]|uniref:DUF4260 domain-containing protein n=1 Tax=Ammoniphilus sp. CFH 90114 TaxID=2493665 RepID=UPI00100F5626|nr:DUF4260 domain-containing protein [Ammoniphilus sp. CFH 90114]RXT05378.1 DUF4260 family protein [Ammoniphilus sp. CFH 90114]